MSVQTEEVRELVDFSPEGFYVTSFYLDVNAAEFPDPDNIVKSMNSLVHQADSDRKEIKADLSHEAAESLRRDLAMNRRSRVVKLQRAILKSRRCPK